MPSWWWGITVNFRQVLPWLILFWKVTSSVVSFLISSTSFVVSLTRVGIRLQNVGPRMWLQLQSCQRLYKSRRNLCLTAHSVCSCLPSVGSSGRPLCDNRMNVYLKLTFLCTFTDTSSCQIYCINQIYSTFCVCLIFVNLIHYVASNEFYCELQGMEKKPRLLIVRHCTLCV